MSPHWQAARGNTSETQTKGNLGIMQIVFATHELARAAHTIIVSGMAEHLIRRGADLQDELAMIVLLAQAGFGHDSIRTLRAAAAREAGCNITSTKVH